MKTFIKISLLGIALTSTQFAFATRNGWYGDLGLGFSNGPDHVVVKNKYFTSSGGTLSANASDVYSLRTRSRAGVYLNAGYNFTPFLGTEFDFTYWGKQNLESFANNVTTTAGSWDGTLETYSFGFNFVGYFPLVEKNLDIFGKIGISGAHSEIKIDDPNGSIFFNPGNYRRTSVEPAWVYGAGIQYFFLDHFAGQLEWKAINRFNDKRISNIHYNLVAVGLRYSYC